MTKSKNSGLGTQLTLINEEKGKGSYPNPITTVTAYTATVYEKKPTDAETEAMLAMIAPQMYSYHVKYDKAELEASTKPQQIFMAYNGIGLRRTEVFNGNEVIITTKTDKAPGLRSVPEGIEFKVVNKIPGSLLRDLIANFKAVFDRDHTESSAQIYRKRTGEYFVYYPVQKNSGANTNYSADLKAAIELRQENTLVLEAHSHASFGAFFSGGDDSNEKSPCMYIVIGSFPSAKPSFVGRIKLLTQQAPLSVTDVFDIPEGEDYLTFENLPEPSPQMLENAKPAYATSTVAGTAAGQATGYGNYRGYGYDYDYGYGGYNYKNAQYGKYYDKDETYAKYDVYKKKDDKVRKFDVKWLSENLSNTEAEALVDLLTVRLMDKKTIEL
mgnify:CR=1 FL=1